jgi:hypothetical protein
MIPWVVKPGKIGFIRVECMNLSPSGETVYTHDSGSCAERRGGSNPLLGTKL